MILYLLVLAVMTAGCTSLALSFLQKIQEKRSVGLYDARGFYLVLLVFITFVLTSLAYFWGEARFSPANAQLSEALVGMLFTLCCCLAGLAFGLVRLKEVKSK